jgi:hypothetical protein
MPDRHHPSRTRRGSQLLSTILFMAAIGFAAAAVYIWYLEDAGSGSEEPPIPTVADGLYDLVNVLEAFKTAGLEADYGRSPATVNANQLDVPGQNLRVEDITLFIFRYSGSNPEAAYTAAETSFAAIDPATLELATTANLDVSQGEPLTVYQGANIVVVMVGGDMELQADVRDVIEGLS